MLIKRIRCKHTYMLRYSNYKKGEVCADRVYVCTKCEKVLKVREIVKYA